MPSSVVILKPDEQRLMNPDGKLSSGKRKLQAPVQEGNVARICQAIAPKYLAGKAEENLWTSQANNGDTFLAKAYTFVLTVQKGVVLTPDPSPIR